VRAGIIKAVDGATFEINRGQTLGVIGESGCGKSVTARAILNMVPKPGKISGGEILLSPGQRNRRSDRRLNITKLDPDGEVIRRSAEGEIGMIFQEPMSSLTPVYTAGTHIYEAVCCTGWCRCAKVGDQMVETIVAHRKVTKQEAREIAIEMLRKVGIPKPEQRVDSYPHQLSAAANASA
jgi:ABC-type dipeptide/oligopeptide/nickel transport system ATPase component